MFTLRRVVKVRLVMDRDGGVTGTQSFINTKKTLDTFIEF